jgi:hypothetical protein
MDLLTLVLDLGDVQSPTVLEALIEEGRRRHITRPKNRQGVREALIQYAEDRLKEARGRERQFSEKAGAPQSTAAGLEQRPAGSGVKGPMTKRAKPRPATRSLWDIYLAQHSPAKWIGTVEPVGKNAAIEEAAELFKANDPKKLIAVQRR